MSVPRSNICAPEKRKKLVFFFHRHQEKNYFFFSFSFSSGALRARRRARCDVVRDNTAQNIAHTTATRSAPRHDAKRKKSEKKKQKIIFFRFFLFFSCFFPFVTLSRAAARARARRLGSHTLSCVRAAPPRSIRHALGVGTRQKREKNLFFFCTIFSHFYFFLFFEAGVGHATRAHTRRTHTTHTHTNTTTFDSRLKKTNNSKFAACFGFERAACASRFNRLSGAE
jgi:hypothetical protein